MLVKKFDAQNYPAIFAKSAHPKMRSRYSFMNTGELVEAMISNGWKLDIVRQSRTISKNKDEKQYLPHIVRLFHDDLPKVADSVPQIIIKNSHNGRTCLELNIGLFRYSCSNRLTVPAELTNSITLKHQKVSFSDINNILSQVNDSLPAIENTILKMQDTVMNYADKIKFLKEAAEARWPEGIKFIYDSEFEYDFLKPNRNEDDNSVWGVFNLLSEKFIMGDYKYIPKRQNRPIKKRRQARSISNFLKEEELNVKLFKLAKTFTD